MHLTQTLKHAVQTRGAHVATVFGERRRTWAQVGERVPRLAAGLRALGARPGERVALLSHNSDDFLEAFYAIYWAGGIAVPLSPRLLEAELRANLADAGAALLIVDAERMELGQRVAAALPALEHLVMLGATPPGTEAACSEQLIAAHAPVPDALRGDDDPAAILYTSGTTGRPKGVLLSHLGIYTHAMGYVAGHELDYETRFLHVIAMCSVGGWLMVAAVTLGGGTHYFLPRFQPGTLLAAIQRHCITHLRLVPAALSMLLAHRRFDDYDLKSVRRMHVGTAPRSPRLIEEARARFPWAQHSYGYGATETTVEVSLLAPADHDAHPASCGQAAAYAELAIVDAQGATCPSGEVGEVTVRGPGVMLGYWNNPQLTATVLRDGWFHTGDLGYLDAEGFLYVVDRLKDVILTGGYTVYSTEVEGVIAAHPAVAMCAVVGRAEPVRGETIHAIVVPRDGMSLTAHELLSFCKTRLAHFKRPRSVEIRDTPLPMSGSGKVLKRSLRDVPA